MWIVTAIDFDYDYIAKQQVAVFDYEEDAQKCVEMLKHCYSDVIVEEKRVGEFEKPEVWYNLEGNIFNIDSIETTTLYSYVDVSYEQLNCRIDDIGRLIGYKFQIRSQNLKEAEFKLREAISNVEYKADEFVVIPNIIWFIHKNYIFDGYWYESGKVRYNVETGERESLFSKKGYFSSTETWKSSPIACSGIATSG